LSTVDIRARKSSSSIIFGSDFVLFLYDVRYYKKEYNTSSTQIEEKKNIT
jgi:hypothetical protein